MAAVPWAWPGNWATRSGRRMPWESSASPRPPQVTSRHAGRLARQAGQVTVGVCGTLARWCGYVLTGVLTEAGDQAGAEHACEAALGGSRDAGDLFNLVGLLAAIGTLALRAGRLQDAAAHLREAVQVAAHHGDWFELLNALRSCGDLAAATGRRAEAATAWAAWAALSRSEGFTGPDDPARQPDWQQARRSLGAAQASAAEERGTAFSLATAAEYALMLTAADPAPDARVPGQLSPRERELVTLVAQGRSDAQIAAELYISIRTVRSHLDRIRDKTGRRRRADLTRLALVAGFL